MRFTSNPPAHPCELEPIQASDLTQLPIDRGASLPIEQRAQAEIPSFWLWSTLHFILSIDGCFQRLLNALVDIGREDRQFRFGGERCPLTRCRMRRAMVDESIHQRDRAIEQFAKRPYVSLVIDAGTFERRHFLDIMILASYSNLRPFLYDAHEQDALTSEDYGRISAEIIPELKTKGV
jgi:hypothetical protein